MKQDSLGNVITCFLHATSLIQRNLHTSNVRDLWAPQAKLYESTWNSILWQRLVSNRIQGEPIKSRGYVICDWSKCLVMIKDLTYKTNGDLPKINLPDRARPWAVVEWE